MKEKTKKEFKEVMECFMREVALDILTLVEEQKTEGSVLKSGDDWLDLRRQLKRGLGKTIPLSPKRYEAFRARFIHWREEMGHHDKDDAIEVKWRRESLIHVHSRELDAWYAADRAYWLERKAQDDTNRVIDIYVGFREDEE